MTDRARLMNRMDIVLHPRPHDGRSRIEQLEDDLYGADLGAVLDETCDRLLGELDAAHAGAEVTE